MSKQCFKETSAAYKRGDIGVDKFLDNHLAHWTGTRHPEDDRPGTSDGLDAVSEAFERSLKMNSHFSAIEGYTALLKKLLLACWSGDLQAVQTIGPEIMQSAETTPVLYFVRLIMVRIACQLDSTALLHYCLSSAPSNSLLFQISMFDDTFTTFSYFTSPSLWNFYLDEMTSKGDISSEGLQELLRFAIHLQQHQKPVELVRALLNHGVVIDESTLYLASSMSDLELVRLILANCDASKMNESHALGAAASEDDTRVLELFLDSGMDINFMSANLGLEGLDPFERIEREAYGEGVWVGTALHYAADGGFSAAVRVLLDRGAKTDIKDSRGRTALQVATEKGRMECAELISSAISNAKDGGTLA